VQANYVDNLKRVFSGFHKKILDYKADLTRRDLASLSEEDKTALLQEISNETNRIVDENVANVMDLVQLESGKYELTLNVVCQNPAAWLWRSNTECHSTITFHVDDGVRDLLRTNLRQTLQTVASNVILEKNQAAIFPEYYPGGVVEVERE
jgi:hypothetical protein